MFILRHLKIKKYKYSISIQFYYLMYLASLGNSFNAFCVVSLHRLSVSICFVSAMYLHDIARLAGTLRS